MITPSGESFSFAEGGRSPPCAACGAIAQIVNEQITIGCKLPKHRRDDCMAAEMARRLGYRVNWVERH
jgi:hypothetical protein